MPELKQGKSRIHLDLFTEELNVAIARVVAFGGRETGERREYDEGPRVCACNERRLVP